MDEVPLDRLETIVGEAFREGIRLKEELLGKETKTILEMAEAVCRAFREDHRLFLSETVAVRPTPSTLPPSS